MKNRAGVWLSARANKPRAEARAGGDGDLLLRVAADDDDAEARHVHAEG